jgi:hypothetical protein
MNGFVVENTYLVKMRTSITEDANLLYHIDVCVGQTIVHFLRNNNGSTKEFEDCTNLCAKFAQFVASAGLTEVDFSRVLSLSNDHERACFLDSLSFALEVTLMDITNSTKIALLRDVVLESILLCSSVPVLRPFFAVHQKIMPEKRFTNCVHTLSKLSRYFPESERQVLAIMQNSCLGSLKVQEAIVAEEEFSWLRQAFRGLDGCKVLLGRKGSLVAPTDDDVLALNAMRVGLLARLCHMPEAQEMFRTPLHYRNLCQALKRTRLTPLSGTHIKLASHLLILLGSLSKIPETLTAIAREEEMETCLLAIFPEPRRELGEFTADSVTLTPVAKMSSTIIGNASQCLIGYCDDDSLCRKIFKNSSLFAIPKLICALATNTDKRVRKNLSVVIAKGCRIGGVKDIVRSYRGLQIIMETQSGQV